MEIQIFDTKGKMITRRHYFPDKSRSETSCLISGEGHGVYIVSIMVDDIAKTKKLNLK